MGLVAQYCACCVTMILASSLSVISAATMNAVAHDGIGMDGANHLHMCRLNCCATTHEFKDLHSHTEATTQVRPRFIYDTMSCGMIMTSLAATKVASGCWHARRSNGLVDLSFFMESTHVHQDGERTLIRHRDDHALDVLPAEAWRVAVLTLGPGKRSLDPIQASGGGVVERTVPFPLDDCRVLVFCREPMPVEWWAALQLEAMPGIVQEVCPVRESVAQCMADVLLGKEGLAAVYAGRFADADDEVYLVNHPAMRGMDLTDVVPHAGRLVKSRRSKAAATMTWSMAHLGPSASDGEDYDDEEDEEDSSQQHEDDWQL